MTTSEHTRTWTFVTNHAAAIVLIADCPDIKLAELALRLHVTERAARRIVKDLIEAGYVACERVGRRNQYSLASGVSMRHPTFSQTQLEQLVGVLRGGGTPAHTTVPLHSDSKEATR
jgi:predicted ArsR family transcriptional regulator